MIILGDTHAEWKMLNHEIDTYLRGDHIKKNKTLDIIVCGDFGYWPNFEKYSLDKINTYGGRVQIYFCPGNHENWWSLPKTNEITEVHENIFYCPFGSTKKFNGNNILFCGGAESTDKNVRSIGYDWFPEEVISLQDMENLPKNNIDPIDVVISHTYPKIIEEKLRVEWLYTNKNNDPSCKLLDYVFNMYNPKLWIFGHLHVSRTINYEGTKFVCLNQIGEKGYRMILGE